MYLKASGIEALGLELKMKNEEVNELVSLRTLLVEQYQSLDGGDSISVAVMKQEIVADVYAHVIERLDRILAQYVNFE